MNLDECAKLLGSRDDYLLLTHRNPDGDTVMSAPPFAVPFGEKTKEHISTRTRSSRRSSSPLWKNSLPPPDSGRVL